MNSYRIILLPGDGIGPEVLDAAVRVLEQLGSLYSLQLEFERFPFGGAAIDAVGEPLPEATLNACLGSDAVLLGAVGGPAWEETDPAIRPESGLLSLRRSLGAFANIRPVHVPDSLTGASPLRSPVVRGTDLVVVRELTGGIYFGKPSAVSARDATSTMFYTTPEIERISRVAFEEAERRRGRVTSVDKANVLAVSRLWREVVTRIHREDFPDVELEHLYVDNAAMQIVSNPRRFDVILTGNLFGDILSDLAATLPGSLGVLPSASVGGSVGLFEPVHGSAPDLAGRNEANPVAAILSAAMMLDDLREFDAAASIRTAVDRTFQDGVRTLDMGGLSSANVDAVGTSEMTAAIVDRLATEHTISVLQSSEE